MCYTDPRKEISGGEKMSVDVLQAKIRKAKNPSILELGISHDDLPPQFAASFDNDAEGCGAYCRELLKELKGVIPAARLSFAAFALMGPEGLLELQKTLRFAAEQGYYVLLDAPEVLSPDSAQRVARVLQSGDGIYPCDGVILPCYLGSDTVKPFLDGCRDGNKDLFVMVRSGNKSASELQDLLVGSRLVHTVAADYVSRFGSDTQGKYGYTQVGIMAAASSAESLRSLRGSYPRLFILIDGFDYPNANAKNCSNAFDRLGHGAAAIAGKSITCAWKQDQTDAPDYIAQAKAAAERMRRNLSRYVTVL